MSLMSHAQPAARSTLISSAKSFPAYPQVILCYRQYIAQASLNLISLSLLSAGLRGVYPHFGLCDAGGGAQGTLDERSAY